MPKLSKVKPTRYYSKKQESAIAKRLDFKRQPNSGATPFLKGDLIGHDFLIECKTKTSASSSISIRRDWLIKNKEEAFSMGKTHHALAFDFGAGETYYVIDELHFKLLIDLLC